VLTSVDVTGTLLRRTAELEENPLPLIRTVVGVVPVSASGGVIENIAGAGYPTMNSRSRDEPPPGGGDTTATRWTPIPAALPKKVETIRVASITVVGKDT
jgi:hypothetical protein